MLEYLTKEGRPLKPASVFVGVQRARLPTSEQIGRSLRSHTPISIAVKWLGRWEFVAGIVTQVRVFNDGMLVLIDSQRYPYSLLKAWPSTPLWIPHGPGGGAGILAYWK